PALGSSVPSPLQCRSVSAPRSPAKREFLQRRPLAVCRFESQAPFATSLRPQRRLGAGRPPALNSEVCSQSRAYRPVARKGREHHSETVLLPFFSQALEGLDRCCSVHR